MTEAAPRWAIGLAGLLLTASAACSSDGGDETVFESVTSVPSACPADAPAGADCFTVVAPVVGEGRGQGRCVVYASGPDDNLGVAARLDGIELEPGDTVRWEVAVTRPADPAFRQWNPVCDPMMEG